MYQQFQHIKYLLALYLQLHLSSWRSLLLCPALVLDHPKKKIDYHEYLHYTSYLEQCGSKMSKLKYLHIMHPKIWVHASGPKIKCTWAETQRLRICCKMGQLTLESLVCMVLSCLEWPETVIWRKNLQYYLYQKIWPY